MMRYQAAVALLALGALAAAPAAARRPDARQAAADGKMLLYADFEKLENNRPLSARGGLIQMFAYEESGIHKSTFKGMAGADPPARELIRIKKDDPNHAMKFDFSLRAPNQYAGVTVEIHGRVRSGSRSHRAGKNGNSRRMSSGPGLRPYSDTSNASACCAASPRSAP